MPDPTERGPETIEEWADEVIRMINEEHEESAGLNWNGTIRRVLLRYRAQVARQVGEAIIEALEDCPDYGGCSCCAVARAKLEEIVGGGHEGETV